MNAILSYDNITNCELLAWLPTFGQDWVCVDLSNDGVVIATADVVPSRIAGGPRVDSVLAAADVHESLPLVYLAGPVYPVFAYAPSVAGVLLDDPTGLRSLARRLRTIAAIDWRHVGHLDEADDDIAVAYRSPLALVIYAINDGYAINRPGYVYAADSAGLLALLAMDE